MTAEPQDQGFPAFYSEAPTIKLRDPLAQFLGAARHGVIEYRYTDVVRLSGHSCPTVAGAYLMALHGLRALYTGGEQTANIACLIDKGDEPLIVYQPESLTPLWFDPGRQPWGTEGT